MRTFKSIEHFKKRLIVNNGTKVNCWDDWGIKIAGRKYILEVYGSVDNYNPMGDCYVIFYNRSLEKRIEVIYQLSQPPNGDTHYIFNFVSLEVW